MRINKVFVIFIKLKILPKQKVKEIRCIVIKDNECEINEIWAQISLL